MRGKIDLRQKTRKSSFIYIVRNKWKAIYGKINKFLHCNTDRYLRKV